jgi:hypothetical protein
MPQEKSCAKSETLNFVALRSAFKAQLGPQRANLSGMIRRGIVLIVALNLLALMPLPLSPCAILAGLDGPCQCMMMNGGSIPAMPASGAPAVSCLCVQVAPPFPSAVEQAASPVPIVVTSSLALPAVPNPPALQTRFPSLIEISQLGPPGGRARLCVFLI